MMPSHARYNREQLEPGRNPLGRALIIITALFVIGASMLIHPAVPFMVLGCVGGPVMVGLLAWHVVLICREDAEIARAREAEREAESHKKTEPPLT